MAWVDWESIRHDVTFIGKKDIENVVAENKRNLIFSCMRGHPSQGWDTYTCKCGNQRKNFSLRYHIIPILCPFYDTT